MNGSAYGVIGVYKIHPQSVQFVESLLVILPRGYSYATILNELHAMHGSLGIYRSDQEPFRRRQGDRPIHDDRSVSLTHSLLLVIHVLPFYLPSRRLSRLTLPLSQYRSTRTDRRQADGRGTCHLLNIMNCQDLYPASFTFQQRNFSDQEAFARAFRKFDFSFFSSALPP